MSTGTIFSKALTEAMIEKTIEDELRAIEDFVNNNTSFKIVSVTLEKDVRLTISAVRKPLCR